VSEEQTSQVLNAAPLRIPIRKTRMRLRLIVIFVILAGALTYILVEGLGSSLDYFDTVNQAMAQRATLGTSTIRLEGTVVNGTVKDTSQGADFTMAGTRVDIDVENKGSPPELFQPGIPVVVVGHFVSVTSNVFLSNQIMVKHTASYIAEHPNRVRAKNGTVR
jgi:cytochrome c-type biogenesis protein CcmE